MREIKFRSWDKEQKVMYEVKKVDFSEQKVFCKQYYLNDWKFSEIELMQYTGLKDATGKEIYEGDIILFRDIKHKVVFIDQHNNDEYTLNPTMLFFGLELEPSKQNR